MSHTAWRDLTEAVHGFAPKPAHADECPACAGRVDRLEEELDLLRRAEARVAPPAASSRGWRRVPVAAAAALLLCVLAYVVGRPSVQPVLPDVAGQAPPDLVSKFLDGTAQESERARAALLEKGAGALAEVVEARLKRPDAVRADALAALVFELKRREAGERGKLVMAKLEQASVTVDMQNAPLGTVMDYLRQVMEVDMVLDRLIDPDALINLKVGGTGLRQTLDLIGRMTGAEYAFRWGRIYFAPGKKLWGPASLPLANRWRAQEPGEAGKATVRKLETMKIDLAFENSAWEDVVDFVRDFSKLNIVVERGFEMPPITLKVKDTALGEVLELLTIPYGCDARLDEGAIVLYGRK